MKRFFSAFLSAMVLISATILGCSNDIDNKSSLIHQALVLSQQSNSYGSLKIEGDSSRALSISDLTNATVTVSTYGKSDIVKENLTISGGTGSTGVIEKVPVGRNVVKVESNLAGVVMYGYVDIESNKTKTCTVNWESSKVGKIYWELLKTQGLNITNIEETAFSSAIPDVHACLVDAAAIASDYKNNSLGASSNYKLEAGKVKITANTNNGSAVQIGDPVSSAGTLSSTVGGTSTIENVAPGTWNIYVAGKKISKTVTVTAGETATVTIGQPVITDKIIVHVAEKNNTAYNPSGFTHIWAWATSGSANYCTNSTWPGDELSDSDSDGWYDYTIKNGSSYVTSSMIILSKAGNPQTSNLTISEAGEYWWNGSAFVTENPALPPEPVAPKVTISPSDGSIALNGSISVAFDDGNDTITSAKVTVNGTEYDMGTTAGTWSKSLSELGITSQGVSVNVVATVINSVGTGSDSASLTTKEPSKLVTNPNELRIYQVMVASFQDGDPSIGYSQMWGPDNALKGGDLQGIINALDYIENLGCNALWMTPIFQSNTGEEKLKATGYFANDYFNVDNHFGTNEKFAELVEACHEKGIAVILDGVFGHNAGYQLVPSPTRNGIKNPGITPSSSNPVDYAGNEDSLKYYSDVARYWITEYKIDGWRFDQCYQVGLGDKDNNSGKFPVNTGAGGHNYWYDIRKVIEEAAASNGTKGVDWGTLGYMVGEHWHGDQTVIQMGSVNAGYTSSSYGDMSKAADGYGLNSCFDFPAYYQVVQGFAQEWGGTTTGNITTGLSYLYKTYSEKGYSCKDDDGTYDVYYPNFMLSNHDLYRIGDLIKKKFSCEYDSEEYTKRNKVLLAAQCAYSGPITIYYGDEIGDHSVDLSGWGGDNVARSSGKITGFNTREQAIHDWTQKCLAARADHEALWNGTNTQITGQSDFYVAKKQGGGETIYIAFNYNSSSSKTFSASGTDLISGQTYSGTVTVPALSAVYVLANN